ncbi:hypothetical protein ABMA27_005379 [Loxostege sticticalis]|uniref:Integrase catalytic domain-containing protein n=2 Tax=Loxostege sticticalis TaxID=481309 RepID=A0ABR3HIY3_LOXSC
MSEHDESYDNDKKLDKLLKKRSSVKGRLTTLKNYIETVQLIALSDLKSVKIKELSIRLEKCQSLFSSFDDIQSQIEELSDDQMSEREKIENDFFFLISSIQDILESATPNSNSTCDDGCSVSKGSRTQDFNNIKLPTIKLPVFDGNYLKWLEFRDTFDSLINSNDSIPTINKFHYLRSSLEGSALVVIKSIEFTSKNYTVAWDLLCERYDNKNILINNHLKALCSIELINKESYKALRYLIDNISKNLRSLNTLGLPTDSWDALVIYLVSTKLDATTNCKWEEHKSTLSNLPTLDDFFQFLRNRAAILENTQTNKVEKPVYQNKFIQRTSNNTKSFPVSLEDNSDASATSYPSCVICNQTHPIYQCPKFKKLTVEERLNEVTRLKLCSTCLRKGHNTYQCRLKGLCRLCKSKHNTLLHINKTNQREADNTAVPSLPISLSAVSVGQVLLCTAMVEVESNNEIYQARALLDTGSQSSFVTDKFKQKIGIPTENINSMSVSGINNAAFHISERCSLTIKSKYNSFQREVQCLVVPVITGPLPSTDVNIDNFNLPKNMQLADPLFYRPSNIDILLGADVFWDIVGTKQMRLGLNKPIMQQSHLGWLISGPICNPQPKTTLNSNIHCHFSKEIHDSLKLFWEIDEFHPDKISPTVEENLCEDHFLEHTCRLPTGRFSVKIPFKEDPEQALGDSFIQAKMRFLNLEKKLRKLPLIKDQYREFIKEYSDLGHLSEVVKPDFGYYLPHHAVIREKSETTKLRVVFDASAKTTSGKSLNDIQLIGPVVQDDLLSILMRFRCHKFVLIADIQKHYRQIEINPDQRHLQLIVWRDEETQPLKVLQLNTVTYGTASAPFLSTRCLLQLARECPDPTIASIIEHDIYVDNLATGASTEEDIRYIFENVAKILNSACFPLHKILTNASNIQQDEDIGDSISLNKESSVLGLSWSPKPDTLHFSIDIDSNLPITKRSILCMSCKIFDPLGLLSACVIKAKIILQKLWTLKLDWDDPVPPNLSKEWSSIANNLVQLSKLQVPRNVICDTPISIELHCFVDASQVAYGTCIYLRSIDKDNNISVKLLCAKARVAPIKPTTIPRLELCGGLLGARLCSKLVKALKLNITQITFWTDSTILLCWIKTSQNLLKAFVSNRIQEINELTSGHTWRHVPTELNPADLASRGVEPQDLIQPTNIWWEGPSYLKQDPVEWPQQLNNYSVEVPELKVHLNVEIPNFIDFNKYSSFNKLKRIYAYFLRFVNNINKNKTKISGSLEVEELNKAQTILIKFSQFETFHSEIQTISKGKPLHHKSRLLPLNPFLDAEGVLRVGGRLKLSDHNYDKRHPIILDKHRLTKLIMIDEHKRLFHAGSQHLLASIRDTFWPLSGRALARSVTKACATCVRWRGKTMQPIMGHLPSDRTNTSFPFYSCGTDFAGPFNISSRKGRGNRITKCYLCIFVCLTTKAVHLEVVSDLSTEAFILCLRRFVSRRGKPHTIHCDNGTNFVGANNELGRMLRSSHKPVCDYTSSEGIIMRFIPAYSPNFGGLWEAGVKSSKFHLKRIAGNSNLTFEELTTLFVQIEAILNSRPLSPISSDPLDLTPITPGHFLIGRPLMSVPSQPLEELKSTNRYHLIERLRQQFWDRWKKEYLSELQVRTKWRTMQHKVKEGEMVLLKEDNAPPLKWRLGRIVKLHPGPDNITRVVDVKTAKGIVRRALNKLVALPNKDVEASHQLTKQSRC